MSSLDELGYLAGWLREQLDADEVRVGVMPEEEGVSVFTGAGFVSLHPVRRELLANVTAKRRTLDEIVLPTLRNHVGNAAAVHLLRLLATTYADRPGYREEWRPADA